MLIPANLEEIQFPVDQGAVEIVFGYDALGDDVIPRVGFHPRSGPIVPADGRSWVTPGLASQGLLPPLLGTD